jgi:hypothetical protein
MSATKQQQTIGRTPYLEPPGVFDLDEGFSDYSIIHRKRGGLFSHDCLSRCHQTKLGYPVFRCTE